jgi:hypothetical protein
MTGIRQFTVASPSGRADRRILQLRADSPAHLEEALWETAADGGPVTTR